MSIWEYVGEPAEITPSSMVGNRYVRACQYCENAMVELATDPPDRPADHGSRRVLHVCPLCGWWVVSFEQIVTEGDAGSISIQRRWPILRQLDCSDIGLPTRELSAYLVAKYSHRFKIHPRRLEDVVAGIFADWGYRVRVTAYSGDDGLDAIVVLDGNGSETVGVQVKRYADRIEAEQIRAFGGALVLNGMTQGIFITTSGFQRGATDTANRFAAKGLAIELWDAGLLYQALRLNRRPMYVEANDLNAPYYAAWHGQPALWPAFGDSWDYGCVRIWH